LVSLNRPVRSKIAIVEPVGGHGGMNYYDFSLADALSSTGMHITLYTCDKTEIPEKAFFLIKKTFSGIWGHKPKFYRAFRFLIGLFRTLIHARWKQVQLIHLHFFHYTILEKIAVILAQFFGFKIVITVHDVESFAGIQDAKCVKTILQEADKLISHNILSKKELIKKMKIDPGKIDVIPHGNYLTNIPFDIGQQEARTKLNIPMDSPVVLFFGQIKEVKGLDILLNALPAPIKKYPKLKLIVAGKIWKDDFQKYQEIILSTNLSDNVDFHIRYIKDEEVPLFYNASDIVVLPYKKIYQSGVLLMAMSYRKPVVVSDLEGMIEIVEDNVNGFVFRSGDPESLSSILIQVLSNSKKLEEIATAGYDTVAVNHDWNLIGQKTAELYRSILV